MEQHLGLCPLLLWLPVDEASCKDQAACRTLVNKTRARPAPQGSPPHALKSHRVNRKCPRPSRPMYESKTDPDPWPLPFKSSTAKREPAPRRRARTPQLAPAILPIVLPAVRSDSDIASSCPQENPSDESRSWPFQTRAAALPGKQSGAIANSGLGNGGLGYGVLRCGSQRSCMPLERTQLSFCLFLHSPQCKAIPTSPPYCVLPVDRSWCP